MLLFILGAAAGAGGATVCTYWWCEEAKRRPQLAELASIAALNTLTFAVLALIATGGWR